MAAAEYFGKGNSPEPAYEVLKNREIERKFLPKIIKPSLPLSEPKIQLAFVCKYIVGILLSQWH